MKKNILKIRSQRKKEIKMKNQTENSHQNIKTKSKYKKKRLQRKVSIRRERVGSGALPESLMKKKCSAIPGNL